MTSRTKKVFSVGAIFFGGFALAWAPAAEAKNLHLIDRDDATGYEIYRTGKPTAGDILELCAIGVTEMMVLSGDADQSEFKYQHLCPKLKVIYNEKQSTSQPVSASFLQYFDQWVESSRHEGKKIAFRCQCGCHRTGRLAGYYQMKYQGLTYADAAAIARKHGKWMIFYPHIFKQMRAMEDYIAGRACSTKSKYCVREDDREFAPIGSTLALQ